MRVVRAGYDDSVNSSVGNNRQWVSGHMNSTTGVGNRLGARCIGIANKLQRHARYLLREYFRVIGTHDAGADEAQTNCHAFHPFMS